ncbi:MAG: hypothetical protein OXL40_10110 [Bacteroidota bacterium]|nr:hypothetical protein [Bacteroidota bacterium]
MKRATLLLMSIVSFSCFLHPALAQWTNFYFTDEWGDETDNLAARSAYTRAAHGLAFPYQDRRMTLIVDHCDRAWIRFDDGIVFGDLSDLRVRVDGKETAVSTRSSSDDRKDIYLRNPRRLVALLGEANSVDFLIPIHDERPARFNLNMSGSMLAVDKVCSKETLRKEAQEAIRADSIRKANMEAIRLQRAGIVARQQKFCEQETAKFWFRDSATKRRFSSLRLELKMSFVFGRDVVVVDREKWDNLNPKDKEDAARGAFFWFTCGDKDYSMKLKPNKNNEIYIYSREARAVDSRLVTLNIETGELTYSAEQ